jgi:hypothetical protein
MTILNETARLVIDRLAPEYEDLTIERLVGGVRVKKPDELLDVLAAGGSGYHFFDKLAPRMVIEKPS